MGDGDPEFLVDIFFAGYRYLNVKKLANNIIVFFSLNNGNQGKRLKKFLHPGDGKRGGIIVQLHDS